MDARRSFSGSGTVTASYAAVSLNWPTDRQPLSWIKALGQGAIGISLVNTHGSLTLKYKIGATNYSDDGKTPLTTDPTAWPIVVAEVTLAAATEALIEVNIAHHLFYAILVIDGSGHATYVVRGGQKMLGLR